MTIKNASILPKVFYGLHFAPGVAEYREEGLDPYRVFINEDTAKKMDTTFPGRPVYVRHVEQVNLAQLQSEADGYVVESFYNRSDGKHWAKFIVVSDQGHEAIRKGWTLSNAYQVKNSTIGGQWHGVDYIREVTGGVYEHLAIVPNPRYAESVILTPEEFKAYNSEKELELKKLSNSQSPGGKSSMFNFFKKTQVENSTDLESTTVVLPKSKKEFTIAELANEMDKIINMHGYAADEHMVKVNDSEELSVKDLRKNYNKMCQEKADAEKESEGLEKGEGKKGEVELANGDQVAVLQDKKNEIDAKAADDAKAEELRIANEKKEADEKADKEAKAKKKENFETLKNAHIDAKTERRIVETSEDRVVRGKSKYGSSK